MSTKWTHLAERRRFRILAVFALSFALQGTTLAVFQGDRPTRRAGTEGSRSANLTAAPDVSSVFVVTSLADSGPGSLRDAILQANNNPGLDQIQFEFIQPVTVTLSSPLPDITDPVMIEAPGPWITETNPGWLTVDAINLVGSPFVISGTTQTSIQRLRIVNAIEGFGFEVLGGTDGTAIISNTIQNALGGILLDNTSTITLTHNALLDIDQTGVQAFNSDNLWMVENMLRNVGDVGFVVEDGVMNTGILSNTIEIAGLHGTSVGIGLVGSPPPIGVQMRGNSFMLKSTVITGTTVPILLGPGANNGFPAPEIGDAFFTGGMMMVSLSSPADPGLYTYPLTIDLYRSRGANLVPLGESIVYNDLAFPNPMTYTIPIPPSVVLPTDRLVVIATTNNPSTSPFSQPALVSPQLPVELTSFEAVTEGDRVVITWSTASETNNAGFEIHHGFERRGQTTWDVVAFVEGGGTTSEPQSYRFEMSDLEIGPHHFRLKQIDFDGSFEFSQEIEAVVNVPGTHVLGNAYPNPFNPRSNFSIAVPTEQSVSVGLYDTAGRLVRTLFEGELQANEPHWIEIDGTELASGLYLYRVVGDSFEESKTVTLQK